MADIYKEVNCSFCNKKDIKWDRYECLICDEYNLCRVCFKDKKYSQHHRPFHPAQLVLNREQFLRYVNSIVPPKDKIRLYCPICGMVKTSVADFTEHTKLKHPDDADRVKCPVCVLFGVLEVKEWKLADHMDECHMERGEDVVCTTCGGIIEGNRYSCLGCDFFDQCEACFKTKKHNEDHLPYHPMQKVLPKAEYESQNDSLAKIYRCPFCGVDDFSASDLANHCHKLHSHSQSVRVCCPICTVCRIPFEENSILKEPFINHLANYHGLTIDLQVKPRECTICLVALDENITHQMYCQCTHNSFHERCIRIWLAGNPTCPICRAKRL